MMPPQRQRQSPAHSTDMSLPSTFRSSIPRYTDMPQDFDASYYQVSPLEVSNYDLTSSFSRPLFMQGPYMLGDFDALPGFDETTSAPMSACGSTTISELSPPQSEDGNDFTFSGPQLYSAAEACGGAVISPELMFSPAYDTYPMEWPSQRPPSPPPESILRNQLDISDSASAFEHLGVSKLQSYSKPRQSPPRPLRPSNERTNSQDSNEENTSPKPKDDPERSRARTDPLYSMKPDQDGWYHCPKKNEGNCKHMPTKQKCIYAKNLDSHLRPYICRHAGKPEHPDCADLRFSSNACLFRHEREAHAMHNHGFNPYRCIYPGCERNKPGNGFPRQWNQRDHMKRVHGHMTEPEASKGNHQKAGRKARQKPGSAPMRRSESGRSSPYNKDARPDVTSRHAQIMYPPVDYTYPMPLDAFQYVPGPQVVYYQGPVY